MASKSKNKPTTVSDKDSEEGSESSSTPKGSLEQIVKKLVKKGKEQGFITYDEMNKALPAQEFSSEQIEDAMATITDVGVQIVESEDDFEEGAERPCRAGDVGPHRQ